MGNRAVPICEDCGDYDWPWAGWGCPPDAESGKDAADDKDEGGALLCSRCGKTLTDDPTLPISQMGGNVFLRSDSPGAGIVVCGACAGRMVLMTLVRQGALAPTHAG